MLSRELSHRVFIGRDEEICVFENMLDDPSRFAWILELIGPGGQGKTQLLNRFAEIAQVRKQEKKDVLVTTIPIDFYWTSHRTELGILRSLASQLELDDEFLKFRAQIAQHNLLLRGLALGELERSVLQARALFVEGYRNLSKEHLVVLLFDTVELATNGTLDSFWVNVLPKLRPNTIVVVSGRESISKLPQNQTLKIEIRGFDVKDVTNYFTKQGIDVSQEIALHIKVLSEGSPILIALVVDWVKDGHALDNLLNYDTRSTFEKAMVDYVHRLRYPEDQTILSMAHLYHRFNEEILEHVLDLPIKATEVISNLSRFTFIKYYPSTEYVADNCLLHDEMRRLINTYVLPAADPMGELRRELSAKAISYYAEKLRRVDNPLLKQDLRLERLHYWFDVNLADAFDFYGKLFEDAYQVLNYSYMALLNKVVEIYDDRLLPEMKRQLDFRVAAVECKKGIYQSALKKLEKLIDADEPGVLEARSFVLLVEIYANISKPDMALDRGTRCESLCDDILRQTLNPSEKEKIIQVRLLLYNNLGYTWRQALGNLDRAIEYYQKALYSPGIEHKPFQLARTRNNLAYALYRKGRIDEALFMCKSALSLRRDRLKDPEQVGLSYNVMGMIYSAMDRDEEAVQAFEEAFNQVNQAKSKRGDALVKIAYGRLLRQLGWHEETGSLKSVIDGVRQLSVVGEDAKDFDEQISRNRKYYKARVFFEDAECFFAEQMDWANHSEALNELGCLFRQVDNVEKATSYFERSIESARKAGNIFREGDSLLDLAITYYRDRDLSRASKYASKAKTVAKKYNQDYLLAKIQHLLAAIAFERHDYDKMRKFAADACIYVVKQRSKIRAYFDVLDSITSYLSQLPSYELVHQGTQFLISRWQEEGLEHQYPGLILRMNTLDQDYLLRTTG